MPRIGWQRRRNRPESVYLRSSIESAAAGFRQLVDSSRVLVDDLTPVRLLEAREASLVLNELTNRPGTFWDGATGSGITVSGDRGNRIRDGGHGGRGGIRPAGRCPGRVGDGWNRLWRPGLDRGDPRPLSETESLDGDIRRIFARHDAKVIREGYGQLPAWFSRMPAQPRRVCISRGSRLHDSDFRSPGGIAAKSGPMPSGGQTNQGRQISPGRATAKDYGEFSLLSPGSPTLHRFMAGHVAL